MQHYSLVFNTTNGSRRSMRINSPNTDLPVAEIETAISRNKRRPEIRLSFGGKRVEHSRFSASPSRFGVAFAVNDYKRHF